jgi:hypothetical protein
MPLSTTWDRRLYFPSEGRRDKDFFARKIRCLRPGLNPRTWVPKASTLPLDHRSRWKPQIKAEKSDILKRIYFTRKYLSDIISSIIKVPYFAMSWLIYVYCNCINFRLTKVVLFLLLYLCLNIPWFFSNHSVLCICHILSYSDWLRAWRSGDRIPVGARFSAPVQTDPESHTASCKMGNGSFPGASCGRDVTLTPHPLLVPRSKIE